uniref:Uncharacterized protein n=1 Tax=Glossina pallidipes TaxID=7398 RepID=A0A1B0AHB2_GLOPL
MLFIPFLGRERVSYSELFRINMFFGIDLMVVVLQLLLVTGENVNIINNVNLLKIENAYNIVIIMMMVIFAVARMQQLTVIQIWLVTHNAPVAWRITTGQPLQYEILKIGIK